MKNEAWKKYTDAGALARVTLRLILPDEKARWDELICQRHYLKNANLVGRQLRYVAELDGEWVALLGWNVPAFHLRPREDWANWSIEQRLKRRKFWVQNSRFLLLSELGKFPNLASRVLGLCCQRLSQDWDEAFGHPLLAAESFVDPQQFTGSCYRASGWELLGQTKGCRRHHRDFYQDDGHPKELWVRPLHPKARTWLGAGEMPEWLARHEDPAMYCTYTAPEFRGLWQRMNQLRDIRRSKGKQHGIASILTICALATLCGAKGTRAFAEFAEYLNQTQLRLLRCYYDKKQMRFIAPSEPTIRRMLKAVPAADIDVAVIGWMAEQDDAARRIAVDGKAVKKARQKDGKQLHRVAAVSHESGRLVAQRPVDEKSNEITALRPMLEAVPLERVIVTADAMHAQQEAAHFLTQEKGADDLFTLKGNQPSVQDKALQLLGSAFPPSTQGASSDAGERTWASRTSRVVGASGHP